MTANLSKIIYKVFIVIKVTKIMRIVPVLLIPILIMLLPTAAVFGEIETRTTDGGSLDINLVTFPQNIEPGDEVKLDITFINPQTQKTQMHIDYFVTVFHEGTNVFGPTNRIHTSEGKVSIPVKLDNAGEYAVKIDADGILFNVIPLETASFSLMVGDEMEPTSSSSPNGCLIATAVFGSEQASQVQMLREIRDNSLLTTQSGTVFLTGFNQMYYLFSPTIADWQRQNPTFNEIVKIAITPLLLTLSVLNDIDMDTEQEVLGYGIGIIGLNLAMYVGLPLIGILKMCQLRKKMVPFY